MPRFQEGNVEGNFELLSKLKELADEKKITPAQLALAWLHAQVRERHMQRHYDWLLRSQAMSK